MDNFSKNVMLRIEWGNGRSKTNGIIWVGTAAPFDTYGSATAFLRWMYVSVYWNFHSMVEGNIERPY